jgi:pimeloyl-ACP methyl ester carboxylesterase
MKRKHLSFLLTLLFCLLFAAGAWAWPPGWQKGFIEENEYYIDTDTGVTIYTVEKKLKRAIPKKNRKAVLLIHGFGIGYPYYDLQFEDYSMMEFLARRGFYVYAVDQRGYGRSTPVSGLTIRGEQSAEDLKSIIDFIKEKAKVDKVNLVGHSWGGVVAIILAGRFQEDVEEMVVIGSPYKAMHPGFQGAADALIALAKAGVDFIPNTHHLTVADSLYSYDDEVIELYQNWVEAMYPMVPTGLLLDMEFYEYSDYVPQIEVPTLLINGANEYVVDFDDAFDFLNDLAAEEKDLLTLGNAPHLVFLEKIAHRRLNQAVANWFLK